MKLSNEIKAALIIFGGTFLFLLGFNFLNGTSLFKKENTLYAIYENVEGLQIGTKVTVNGLSVGKVATIDFLPDSKKILVSFTLRNDVSFSKNSTAELYEAGLIGGKSIAIHPAYDQAAQLQEGDTLITSIKPGLTDVVNQQIAPLQQKLESVLVNADSLVVGMNNTLNKEGQANLANSLQNLAETLDKINRISGSLDRLLTKQEGNLETTLTNMAKISQNVNQFTDSLAQADINSMFSNFDTTLHRLNKVLNQIDQGKGTLGKLLKEDGLYQNLEASTKEIELLLRDLKEHPKRYVHFSLFGKKETPYEKEKED